MNHFLCPVLNIWALVPKASDWGFWGLTVVAIFSEYHGLLPLAELASLASPWPGHTSYCVHQPRLVTHPSVLLLLPTKSVLALISALHFSLREPQDYQEVLFGAAPILCSS